MTMTFYTCKTISNRYKTLNLKSSNKIYKNAVYQYFFNFTNVNAAKFYYRTKQCQNNMLTKTNVFMKAPFIDDYKPRLEPLTYQ